MVGFSFLHPIIMNCTPMLRKTKIFAHFPIGGGRICPGQTNIIKKKNMKKEN